MSQSKLQQVIDTTVKRLTRQLANNLYSWYPTIGDIVLHIDGMEYKIIDVNRYLVGIVKPKDTDLTSLKLKRLHTTRSICIEANEADIQFSCYKEP